MTLSERKVSLELNPTMGHLSESFGSNFDWKASFLRYRCGSGTHVLSSPLLPPPLKVLLDLLLCGVFFNLFLLHWFFLTSSSSDLNLAGLTSANLRFSWRRWFCGFSGVHHGSAGVQGGSESVDTLESWEVSASVSSRPQYIWHCGRPVDRCVGHTAPTLLTRYLFVSR